MGRAGHFYREFSGTRRWTSFRVKVETSDIYVRAYGDFSEVMGGLVEEARRAVRSQIERQESFLTSFDPVPRMKDAHPVVEAMYRASEAAGVGPMAAVAGAIAEYAGRALLERSPEVLVENGGDIWLSAREAVTLAVYAGGSRFTGNLAYGWPRKHPGRGMHLVGPGGPLRLVRTGRRGDRHRARRGPGRRRSDRGRKQGARRGGPGSGRGIRHGGPRRERGPYHAG